ncbi:MAG: hypothetical protein IJW71_01330 [Clostridia bacterium]|nr:hypothetical protein [Clostridia bacterium]
MTKQIRLSLIFTAVFLVLFAVYLVVVNPFAEEQETPSVLLEPEEGEGAMGKKRLLYEKLEREQIKKITYHVKSGEYQLVSTGKNSSDFHIAIDGELYDGDENPAPVFDEYGLSYAITSVACLYVRERLIEGTVTDEVMASYGLTAETCEAWFELELWETDKDGASKTLRVYVGKPTVNGQTYYVGLEGRNAVYINDAASLQYALSAPETYLVSPTLTTPTPSGSQSAQYHIGHFAILGGQGTKNELHDTAGYRVKETDVAFVSYRIIRGVSELYHGVTQIDMSLDANGQSDKFARLLRPYILNAEIGETISQKDVDIPKNEGYPSLFAGSAVKIELTVEYCYNPRLLINVIGEKEEDIFHADASYVFTAPSNLCSYVVSTPDFQNVLDNFAPLVGSEIVSIGLNGMVIPDHTHDGKECRLDHMTLLFGMPTAFREGDDGNPYVSDYAENRLYISEKHTENGKSFYYVGSSVYSIIAKVDAATLKFLEDWELDRWVSDYLQGVHYYNVKGADYKVNFDDFKGEFNFRITRENNEASTGNPVLYVTETLSGERVNASQFNMLNALFVYTKLKGTADLTLDLDSIMTEENCMLTYTLHLMNGESHVYRFYPYSSGRVLLSLDGDAQFYLYTSDLKTIVYNLIRLMNGETIDTGVRY